MKHRHTTAEKEKLSLEETKAPVRIERHLLHTKATVTFLQGYFSEHDSVLEKLWFG